MSSPRRKPRRRCQRRHQSDLCRGFTPHGPTAMHFPMNENKWSQTSDEDSRPTDVSLLALPLGSIRVSDLCRGFTPHGPRWWRESGGASACLRPLSRIHAPRTNLCWNMAYDGLLVSDLCRGFTLHGRDGYIRHPCGGNASQTSDEDSRPTDCSTNLLFMEIQMCLRPLTRIHAPPTTV